MSTKDRKTKNLKPGDVIPGCGTVTSVRVTVLIKEGGRTRTLSERALDPDDKWDAVRRSG